MDLETVVDALTLRAVPGVGDRLFKLLVDAQGDAASVLRFPVGDLDGSGRLSEDLVARIRAAPRHREDARREVERTVAAGFRLIPYGSPEYPTLLGHISDPPAVLFVAGTPPGEDRPTVALVGSRRATTQGVCFARRLAGDLAAVGVTVVSGLAQGVDAAAHRGALAAGGGTVAVFGSGLDVVYPSRNASLAGEIRAAGARVSELPLGTRPLAHHFHRRNRVISGLALGVVVVEAAARSGSLITARLALEQGREVFAVPGVPGSYNARGTHGLLRLGAKLVEDAEDVLSELPPFSGPVPRRPQLSPPAPALRPLWDALEEAPRHIDEVAGRAGMEAGEAAAGLMELTLTGHAEEWPGKQFTRGDRDPSGHGRRQ